MKVINNNLDLNISTFLNFPPKSLFFYFFNLFLKNGYFLINTNKAICYFVAVYIIHMKPCNFLHMLHFFARKTPRFLRVSLKKI